MRYSSIRTMSIVTNQGKVWQISKTSKINFDEAKARMVRAIAASDGNKDQAIEYSSKGATITAQKGEDEMLDGDNLTMEEYEKLFADMEEVRPTSDNA